MAEEKSVKETKTSAGMDPKVAALLCWLFAPISSIIFMVLDDMKKDEFIQFNAKESLFFFIAQMLVALIPFLGWIIAMAFWIARIVIAIKAYNGEKVVLPIIGDMASK